MHTTKEMIASWAEHGINPRYEAYAAAHGKTAAEMHAHDGNMIGFVCWVSEKLNPLKKRDRDGFESYLSREQIDDALGVKP